MFDTIITYSVYITTKVPDQCNDLGVKGRDHIYLKSVYGLLREFLFHFYGGG